MPGSAVKHWSLRLEIIVSLALLVSAASGLMGVVAFQYTKTETLALKTETALVLVKSFEGLLIAGGEGELPREVVGLISQSGFDWLTVVDRTGRRLTGFGELPERAKPGVEDLLAAAHSGEVLTFLNKDGLWPFSPDPTLSLAVPLYDGYRVVGAVGMYSPLTRVHQSWRRTRLIMYLFLALSTGIIVLFGAYLLSRRFVRPLRHVVDRIEKLAEGKFKPGAESIDEENEIGRLEEAFDNMAIRLLRSQARLEANIRELERTRDDLVRSEKMASVGRLAAGLAHELGNPLSSLLGFVHLLKDSKLPVDERADFLRRMEGEMGRMDEIIRTLLDFARPTPGKPGPVNLNKTIREALALAEVQKCFAGVDVETDLDETIPPVMGEVNRLTQVLINIFSNAGQAMEGRGALTVSTGADDGNVYAAVADTGPGIADEDKPHLFEPFFTRKEPGKGTGLGLSVSLSIVESFGGRIEVGGRPGGGAVFTIYLPEAGPVESA